MVIWTVQFGSYLFFKHPAFFLFQLPQHHGGLNSENKYDANDDC